MMEKETPHSPDKIRNMVNGTGRNVTRPVVESKIARAVYKMRVDPFGEGESAGGNTDVDQTTDGKPGASAETLPNNGTVKKPARGMIVPY